MTPTPIEPATALLLWVAISLHTSAAALVIAVAAWRL